MFCKQIGNGIAIADKLDVYCRLWKNTKPQPVNYRYLPLAISTTKGVIMITALVQFKLPKPLSRDKAREIFASTAPKYREIHGLIRKYYILSKDGGRGDCRI
jgi:hypothetical protein